MNKFVLGLVFCLSMVSAFAEKPSNTLSTGSQALELLKHFNPQAVFGATYTDNPPEASIAVPEGENTLPQLGNARASQNEVATSILSKASRPHLKANPNALEMQYAEKLLSHADAILEGDCYEEPAHCQIEFITKTCTDKSAYREETCGTTLSLDYKNTTQSVNRYLFYNNQRGSAMLRKTIQLSACDAETPAPICSATNLITISPQCMRLTVLVSQGGIPLPILKAPSCQDPTMTFDLLWDEAAFGGTITISAIESKLEDKWSDANCSQYDEKIKAGSCIISASDLCLEPNSSRVIDGVLVTRPCWGKYTTYQCMDGVVSTCEPLLAGGCSQVESSCTLADNGRCEAFLQTFRCPINQCFPKQTICSSAINCANGECADTKAEFSNDMAEGLTHLGALAGVAGDVATKQVNTGSPNIFAGESYKCKSYPLGIHDCCRDKGWGKWAIHCPADLQKLLKAKKAKRAFKIGHYSKNFVKHYVYCVFPSTLAGIFQIQGRYQQLHLGFGEPKSPDCRGMTPAELERIDFDRLNLSALTDEFKNRQTLPNGQNVSAFNEVKIARFYQEGKAHD